MCTFYHAIRLMEKEKKNQTSIYWTLFLLTLKSFCPAFATLECFKVRMLSISQSLGPGKGGSLVQLMPQANTEDQ